MASPSTPISIVGGYLGAGKTTVINHWLRYSQGERLAVLVNELGELPIDADLIESADENVIAITGGCVCCSYGDDMVGALLDLAKMAPAPEHVIIEASGVALPGAIADTVALLAAFRTEAIWVLADAETIERQARDRFIGDTIERQLAAADIIVLTKADLIPPQTLEQRQLSLSERYPDARFIPSTRGAVPRWHHPGPDQGQVRSAAAELPHDTSGYTHFVVPVPMPVDPERLAEALSERAAGLLRAKGFVRGRLATLPTDLTKSEARAHSSPEPCTESASEAFLIQVVGRRADVQATGALPRAPALECIGLAEQIDRGAIERAVEHAALDV